MKKKLFHIQNAFDGLKMDQKHKSFDNRRA